MYYCQELDTKTRLSLGDYRKKEGVLMWKMPPIYTKFVIKQRVSPLKRLIADVSNLV